VWGRLAGLRGPVLLTLLPNSVHLGLANDVLLNLALTVAAAPLGGLYPAPASAAVGSVLLDWFFTPPVNRITIADPGNRLALAMFVGVALSVASVVDVAARRTHQAAPAARRVRDPLLPGGRRAARRDEPGDPAGTGP
jgi:two-component system sensor histidine kinase KdpD